MYRQVKRTPRVFDHRPALLKAIKICDYSQQKLADLTGIPIQKINYLLNRSQKIKPKDAWAIQEATGQQVKWYELAEPDDFTQVLMEKTELLQTLGISVRVETGLVYEAELRSQPVGSVKGRIESLVAPRVHFGNYYTYRQAKKVKSQGIPELVVAMDLKRFKVFPLSRAADYSPEIQRYLLTLTRRHMNAWMDAHPITKKTTTHQTFNHTDNEILPSMDTVWISSRRPSLPPESYAPILKMIRTVLTDSALKQAEKNSQLPLRLYFFSLLFHADE